uniref:Uncharacterized protein n=1 Tax=Dictyopteris divaricata TaxID=156996 RepID=A0A2I4Q2C6_9PHAE|nr:hypothetical protein [Dictyopteris divaricata]YP_010205290.1 hypothetical protein LK366_pgp101 [Grateloupia livida]AQZ25001.1 hypothetical protein [Dictyopteris divaricata]UAV85859.1 hypothetical protein [Grateloupia livida]
MNTNSVTMINVLSIITNIFLILIIILRSPNEQSLQENLNPFPFFESSSKAERSLDKFIFVLTTLYFLFGIFFTVRRSSG